MVRSLNRLRQRLHGIAKRRHSRGDALGQHCTRFAEFASCLTASVGKATF
jgi:hypothetical protein